MKRLTRYALAVVILCIATLSITSCEQSKRPKYKFQVVSVDGVSGSFDEGWNLVLTVANNTASDIIINEGWAQLRHNGRGIGQVKISEPLVLQRRHCGKVVLPLKVSLSLNTVPVLTKIYKGDYSDITIDYALSVKGIFKERVIEEKGVPLASLAQKFNFGLTK